MKVCPSCGRDKLSSDSPNSHFRRRSRHRQGYSIHHSRTIVLRRDHVDNCVSSLVLISARSDINTPRHRLHTIVESDRVLVLDQGQIAEFDTTQNLLENKKSLFHALATEAGIINGSE